ncbi:DUF4185 domain-containing protein [Lentzea kentuckyensis]|uniref:DUF4185 domain-containing protein n=1 Tax=Lentzea kentuckyensis TaxID=360086 RepID=UPI001FECB765|nr:DUF4185 domain-containing protein [Lentzea kentuckyensis]
MFRSTALVAAIMLITTVPATPARSEPATTAFSLAQPVALVAGKGAGDINDTSGRFTVHATDLGIMWRDSRGRVATAFGDTYGADWTGPGAGGPADWRFNTLAHSGDTNLADGMRIDSMVTDRPGHAKQILPRDPAVPEVTVIPTAGVSVGSRDYLHYMSVRQWGPGEGRWQTNYAGLAYSDDGGQTWVKSASARWQNAGGSGRFQLGAFAKRDGYVYLFGTPNGRVGTNAHVARVPEARVLDTSVYEYWTATGWRTGAVDDSLPVISGPVGELSVIYNSHLGRWVALHLDLGRRAIVLRTATAPTGPWTGGQVVAHDNDYPGLYGSYLHPDSANGPELYFAMSQWTPYHVRLMRLRLGDVAVESNLLQDGGFENRPAGAGPAPWRINGRGGIDYGGQSHTGTNNGWVRHNSGWNDLFQSVVVQPGRRYRLTAWVRSSDTNSAGYFGARRPFAQGVVVERQFGHLQDYTQLSVEFTAGADADLEVFIGGWSVSGQDFWIQVDDVVLE